jgi:hypothetical protein
VVCDLSRFVAKDRVDGGCCGMRLKRLTDGCQEHVCSRFFAVNKKNEIPRSKMHNLWDSSPGCIKDTPHNQVVIVSKPSCHPGIRIR